MYPGMLLLLTIQTIPPRSPSRPDRVDPRPLRHLHDKRHIGVVVVVGSPGDLDKLIRKLDVLCIDADVVGSGLK